MELLAAETLYNKRVCVLGDIGTIIADDGSSKPFRVQASDGRKWWYQAAALEQASGSSVDSSNP